MALHQVAQQIPIWRSPPLVIMSVWRLMGSTMILFLVGLNNIPNELERSGAHRRRQ